MDFSAKKQAIETEFAELNELRTKHLQEVERLNARLMQLQGAFQVIDEALKLGDAVQPELSVVSS